MRLQMRSFSTVNCRAAATVAEGQLQTPHGGKLVDLMAPTDQHAALKASASRTLQLSDRNACDVELLTVGWGSRAHVF